MNMFTSYVTYLKDNPEGFWFKRKLYGWGWTPARWQGWVVIGVYVVAVLAMAFLVTVVAATPEAEAKLFLASFFILTVLLVLVTYWKGEPPRWQWGPENSETKTDI